MTHTGRAGPATADARPFTAVLTRPSGQSDDLAAQLAGEGIDVLEFPLIGIAPVEDDTALCAAFAALSAYALVVFVSPNAIDRAFAQAPCAWPAAVPIGVVGPGSVAALARHGIAAPDFQVICPAANGHAQDDPDVRFDSEALFAALQAQLGEHAFDGKPVLIVRGDGGREWLADRLREAGATVQAVAAYRRIVPAPAEQDWARVRTLLAGAPHAWGWVVTSSEGVRNLHALARAHLTEADFARLAHVPFVAPHPRIAETARALGFDSITSSGPGDARIAAALRALSASSRASLDQPALASSAHSRMTDSNHDSPNPPATSASVPPFAPPPPVYEQARRRRGGSALLWAMLVLVTCAAGVGAFALNRKVDRLEARLAARQQAIDAQTAELRVKTEQAVATVHQIDTQFAQLQGKLADAQTAQQALQQQYQDLARNRDDWMFAEVEQMLSSASEQLQLTGNTQLALFALQSADTRLATSASAQAIVVRRAIAQDIDKLKSAPSTDLTGLAIKLDEAIDQIDTLPLAGEVPVTQPAAGAPASAAGVAGQARWARWWQGLSAAVGQELKGLVQVRRIDNADAMLIAPEQGQFVRDNVKLRLLAARLALLSRNATTLKADLHAADAALARYFDGAAKRTQTVRGLLKEVGGSSTAVELPNLNTSLQAVHNTKSRG
ncbi:fused uroporphyrinogen-III synthase HemD/membrane protein HemX [Trinickia fusca]|uniref:Fused uroporphyrinogen-III synthase HemD/membrane protein HemX n=1 Tax=Trinickia fusca TaxID=2419777 RepID=A0A494X9Z9_9BURK|nr:fused uroporphyrinogen-III synthase HemD/membrane protein HemX [Trinickia fusca]RKP44964.1 fused uroporphyrinogen-III synthase HemD/membrane protein HemX [Trinickia fusca]